MSTSPPLVVADRYRLVAPLGQGGMGRVWRATDVVLHRDVAIKELVPPPGLTPDERREMRERSLREARAIARLNNINVVRVFDVLRTDADPWIVMEYVPSRSLQDILASDGPMPPVRAAEVGLGVLNALRAAHRNGVVHRDVKPGNVLIGEDGRVVLTDFGLATVPGDPNVTRTGLVLGSPAYIAPERARDGTAGPGADLWSLGATLYAAVEGASPFARPSAIATLAALATENPPPARNAGPLKPVLNGLLRKDPAHRINAEEAERLLLRATGRRSKLTFPMSPTMRRPGIGRERPALRGTPPVIPGSTTVSGSAPVVPGPRPPVSTGRPPAAPGGPPAKPDDGRRPPVFVPGKASVGRPAAENPTRVDAPKVETPRLDATRVDTPPVRDNISGTGTASPQTPVRPGPEVAPTSPAPSSPAASAHGALSRGTRGAFGTISAAEVAAHRRRASAPVPPPAPTASAAVPVVERPAVKPATDARPAPVGESAARPATVGEPTTGRATGAGTVISTSGGSPALTGTSGTATPDIAVPAPKRTTAPATEGTAAPAGSTAAPAAEGTSAPTGSTAAPATEGTSVAARSTAAASSPTKAAAPATEVTTTPASSTAAPPPEAATAATSTAPERTTITPGNTDASSTRDEAAESATGSSAKDAAPAASPSGPADAAAQAAGGPLTDAEPSTGKPAAPAPATNQLPATDKSPTPATERAAAGKSAAPDTAAKPSDAPASESSASRPTATADEAGTGTDRTGAGADEANTGAVKADAAAVRPSIGKADSAADEPGDAQQSAAKPVPNKPAVGARAGAGKSSRKKGRGRNPKVTPAKEAIETRADTGSAPEADKIAAADRSAEVVAPPNAPAAGPAQAEAAGPTKAEGAQPAKAEANGLTKGEAAAPTGAATAGPAKAGTTRLTKAEAAAPTKAETADKDSTKPAGAIKAAATKAAATKAAPKAAAPKAATLRPGNRKGTTASVTAASASGTVTESPAGTAIIGVPAARTGDTATPGPAGTVEGTRVLDTGAAKSLTGGAGTPGFPVPSRPAWQPMAVPQRPASSRGVTVFGTTLTRRQTVIGVAILAVVLLALVLLVPRAFGDDAGDGNRGAGPAVPPASAQVTPTATTTQPAAPPPATTEQAATSAPPTSQAPATTAPTSAAPAGTVPDGFYLYRDPTGFSVPVPNGLRADRRGSEVYFRDDRGGRLLIIDQTDQPKSDPVADWKQQEADRRGRTYRDYQPIRIDAVQGYFQKAADWEFRYTTSRGNPQHAQKRGFVTGPNQAYGISWYTSPEDWDANRPVLESIYKGFKPANS